MNEERIQQVPIAKIRVVNPRSRNKKTFASIVANIDLVGLKKPITVFRRPKQPDGTEYDLVCGQGRMEAVAALGGRSIPAIITEAPLNERYLMSLVENVARKRPPQSDLLDEVRRLKHAKFKNAAIANKLGLGKSYVDGIARLLRQGEVRLVEQVAAGTIPLGVAITISTEPDSAVQQSLNAAYETGELRGAKLVAVQRLLAKRRAEGQPRVKQPGGTKKSVSARELVKEYEAQTYRQRDLVRRAVVVRERLGLLSGAFRTLMQDKDFMKLLEREGLPVPDALQCHTSRKHNATPNTARLP